MIAFNFGSIRLIYEETMDEISGGVYTDLEGQVWEVAYDKFEAGKV